VDDRADLVERERPGRLGLAGGDMDFGDRRTVIAAASSVMSLA
jgi:hypothetical protein